MEDHQDNPEEPHWSYDYKKIEAAIGPTATWLLINALANVELNWGTSARYGWADNHYLVSYVRSHTVEELLDVLDDKWSEGEYGGIDFSKFDEPHFVGED